MARASRRRDDREAGAVFAALADPTRRRIVELLSERGAQTPTELASRLPITRQGVAKHLDLLDEAGLVEWSRTGRESRYRLTPEPFETAAMWMHSVGAAWDRRLEALRDQLDRR